MKKIIFKCFIFLLMVLFLNGCNNTKYNGELNVLNWSSYIPYDIINDFSEEYNIKVNYGTYSSNEELLAKISSSKEGMYDLIFPSDYMIELMIEKGMLEKMDKNEVKNFENINPLFLNQSFDKNNDYSLPFLAATSVIAVNRDNVKDEIRSYNDLLKDKFKNNIVLLDDQRIVIGMSLQANGFDMNETDEKKLEIAKNWLRNLNKKYVKAFDSDSPKTFLITNEVDVGVIWNAEARIAEYYNPNIEIIYPDDGFAISLDNYALVKGAKNKENAYKFIDYILSDEVNKRITDEYPYLNTTINNINVPYDELLNILEKGSYVKNVGSKISLFDKVWAQIK